MLIFLSKRYHTRALCIIVDDMVDTGGTLDNAVRLLKGAGARKIIAFATHGRFSGGGEERVADIPYLDCLVICNTLPHRLVRHRADAALCGVSSPSSKFMNTKYRNRKLLADRGLD